MPGSDRAPVLVWRRGEALLAAPVDAVIEVAAVPGAGPVPTRRGAVPLVDLPGLALGRRPERAVVVRTADGPAALPADSLEGIRAVDPTRVSPPPPWLAGLAPAHVRGLIVLDDDRPAALLAVDALRRRP